MESQNLEQFKKSLHQLHFLLTEKETEESRRQALEKFEQTALLAVANLNDALQQPLKKDKMSDVFEQGHKEALFNSNSLETLQELAADFSQLNKARQSGRLYEAVRDRHARMLQMLYDMLERLGEDTEDEDDA